MRNDNAVNMSKTIELIKEEINSNESKYAEFVSRNLKKQTEEYLEERKWDNEIGDIMPKVLSEVSKSKIIILNYSRNKLINCCSFGDDYTKHIVIGRCNDHY